MKRLLNLIGSIMLVMLPAMVIAAPVDAFSPPALHVFADTPVQQVCAGIGLTSAGGNCGDNGAQVQSAITLVVNLLTSIVGIVAVIMIIVAGLRMITAGGDANKVAGARTSIVYGIIGLVVVVFAQTIVHFVLVRA